MKPLTKREFIEVYNNLPQEKKSYGLFYIGGKQNFATWEFLKGIMDKTDKISKEIKNKFQIGRYWEKPSCTASPLGYSVYLKTSNQIVVCSETQDIEDLVRRVDMFTPCDIGWTYLEDGPCQHNKEKHKHHTLVRVYKFIPWKIYRPAL